MGLLFFRRREEVFEPRCIEVPEQTEIGVLPEKGTIRYPHFSCIGIGSNPLDDLV
jgi:hypothetical protein